LTTAQQPVRAMARAAIAAVLNQAEPEHLVFDMPLVIRRSCGCPPA
jgi:DNA-binding LacI/PurR family transcriptional regulator